MVTSLTTDRSMYIHAHPQGATQRFGAKATRPSVQSHRWRSQLGQWRLLAMCHAQTLFAVSSLCSRLSLSTLSSCFPLPSSLPTPLPTHLAGKGRGTGQTPGGVSQGAREEEEKGEKAAPATAGEGGGEGGHGGAVCQPPGGSHC